MSKHSLFSLLKHQISVMENVNLQDLGEEIWQEKYKTFAEIKPLYDNNVGSIESFSFGHIVTEGYFMFKIRALHGITSKMRIKFHDRLFEIKRIIDIEEKNFVLKIIALEV